VKGLTKKLLPAMIVAALAVNTAYAQTDEADCEELEGTPPGLYVTTDEGRTYLNKDGEMVELGPGQTGFADDTEVKCIKQPPKFLDWPCATDAAQSRMFNTYPIEDLQTANKMKEVVQRYFDVPEVIAPIPNWIDGEYHGVFPYSDIIQFASPEYWYLPADNLPILSGKRPRSLQIALFVGTNQVVIDSNMIDALRKDLGTNELPVTFIFNDSNSVPISYFGANVSLEEVRKAFGERAIKVADVPMWWQGDHHLRPTIEEFEKYFEIPELDDIPADKLALMKQDLDEHGFSRKPILVVMFAESGAMSIDQPQRVRVAASMGYTGIPTVISFIEQDVQLARCGPGTPTGTSGVSGSTTPIGGPTVPPGAAPPPAVDPEPPPPPASPS
jgi:hypothetical protein